MLIDEFSMTVVVLNSDGAGDRSFSNIHWRSKGGKLIDIWKLSCGNRDSDASS